MNRQVYWHLQLCVRHDKDLSTSSVFTAGNICDEIASGSK